MKCTVDHMLFLYFTVSLLEASCLLIVFCWYNTFRVMAKNMQLICKKYQCTTTYRNFNAYQHDSHNGYNKCCNCSIIWLNPTTVMYSSLEIMVNTIVNHKVSMTHSLMVCLIIFVSYSSWNSNYGNCWPYVVEMNNWFGIFINQWAYPNPRQKRSLDCLVYYQTQWPTSCRETLLHTTSNKKQI